MRLGFLCTATDHFLCDGLFRLVLRLFLLVNANGADDFLILRHIKQTHTRTCPANNAHAAETDADQLGLIGDQHQLITGRRGKAGHHLAIALDVVDIGDAHAAAASPAIFISG